MEANATPAFFNRPFFKALMADKVFRDAERIAAGAACFRIGISAESVRNERTQSSLGSFTRVEVLFESADLDMMRQLERTLMERFHRDGALSRKCRSEVGQPIPSGMSSGVIYVLYVAYAPFVPTSAEQVLFPRLEGRLARKSA